MKEIKKNTIMDSDQKKQRKNILRQIPFICQECVEDDLIYATRDIDGICFHCGKKLCATHLVMHLEEVHCVQVENGLHKDLEQEG